MDTEKDIFTMLDSYRRYKNVIESLKIAKEYYSHDYDDFGELVSEYQEKIRFIVEFVKSFAPSNIFIVLNLHYLNGVPHDKVYECMGISRSSYYRLLNRTKIAVQHRYNRMTQHIVKDCHTCKHLVSCEPNTSGKFECWEGKDE